MALPSKIPVLILLAGSIFFSAKTQPAEALHNDAHYSLSHEVSYSFGDMDMSMSYKDLPDEDDNDNYGSRRALEEMGSYSLSFSPFSYSYSM